jgi:hypothetical protein
MILALSLALSTIPNALATEFSSPEQVLATFKDEPLVAEVQQMALDYSKTDPHYLDGWLKAAKSAAALPSITLYYNYKQGFDTGYGYYTPEEIVDDSDTSITASDADALSYGPFETDQGISFDHQASVRATWRLDELVMSSDEIRIINEAQDIVKLRDKVLEDVTRLYFERRRLQVDLLLGGGGDLKKRVGDELRMAELTAQLDAYTGGRFSRRLPAR